MALLKYKNNWGTQNSQLDPLRPDLFRISLNIPSAVISTVGAGGGPNLWDSEVSFGVEKFPFPAREREMIAIKQFNQTNFVIGADSPTAPVDVTIRWAFNRATAEVLERWHQLTSNPQNGGVAVTSEVKTDGYFYYLVPNMPDLVAMNDPTANATMQDGPSYYLEGVLIRGLKPMQESDMSVGNQIVTLAFNLQIDRYYPITPSDLTMTGAL
jgi:hypothetical protein